MIRVKSRISRNKFQDIDGCRNIDNKHWFLYVIKMSNIFVLF
jgi:hypothetical protein